MGQGEGEGVGISDLYVKRLEQRCRVGGRNSTFYAIFAEHGATAARWDVGKAAYDRQCIARGVEKEAVPVLDVSA